MCGIAGFLTLQAAPLPEAEARAALRAMRDSLVPRGPDEGGEWLAPGVGLGSRRLSIIDVAGSQQPQAGPSGRTRVVYNGEVYNYRDLRAELVSRGHVLRTEGDTETLPHLFEEFGIEGCLERLVGMFAFALHDARDGALYLARDRLGIKPLYWTQAGGHLLFGSELKALLAHPACPREVDPGALLRYLLFEYVPSPGCIYRGVHKLSPGHYLVARDGHVEVREWWRPTFRKDGQGWKGSPLPPAGDARGWAAAVRADLEAAVDCRLVSEVPIGCLLSGGLDSSAVTAVMARKVPDLRTFSIAFDEASFDESSWSRKVARHLGTRHTEGRVRAAEVPGALERIGSFLDEPLGDGSLVPTWFLSRLVKENGVTVVLSGDGGDEVFAGYPTYLAHRLARPLGLLPAPAIRALARAAGWLPARYENVTFEYKLRRFLEAAARPLPERNNLWLGAFLPEEARGILAGGPADPGGADPFAEARAHVLDCDAGDEVERAQYLDMRMYMGDDILVKVDRASMAVSLEVRVPLLDHRLVERACRMPPGLKLRGRSGKWILKEAVRDLLPAAVLDRPKKGFGLPVGPWLRGPLREIAGDLLSPSAVRRAGLFDPGAVGRLWDEHQGGRADRRRHLWSLLVFQLWHDGPHGPAARGAGGGSQGVAA
ncbi:asparagine synthase (glutamine-hydrolyzing) [Myxococcota bacterium]|nr:asparagine synthase (glutamine-hydrolyzing) [Myxococcota bacterium]